MTTPTRKTCSRCRRRRALNKFARFHRGKHGRQAWCQDCVNQRKRELRAMRDLPPSDGAASVGPSAPEVPAAERTP